MIELKPAWFQGLSCDGPPLCQTSLVLGASTMPNLLGSRGLHYAKPPWFQGPPLCQTSLVPGTSLMPNLLGFRDLHYAKPPWFQGPPLCQENKLNE